MKNILIQKIKEQLRGVGFYALGLLAYLWLLISMFPTMKSVDLDQMIKQMPEDMIKFFGGADTLQYSTIEGFLSLEYLGLFYILIVSFFIGSSAGSAIAGNRERHLTDFELSQPVSRTAYSAAQFSVTAIYTTALAVFNSLAIYLLCHIYDVAINVKGLLAFTLLSDIFLLAWVGIASLLSSVLKSKTAVTLATAGLVLGSNIIYALAGIVEKMKGLDKYTIFYLYEPQEVIAEASVNAVQILLLLLIFMLGTTLAIVVFNKKDL